MNEVHDMLNRMVELATKAANGVYTESQRGNYADEVEQLKSEINRIADSTNFNSLKLLDGTMGLNGDAFGCLLALAALQQRVLMFLETSPLLPVQLLLLPTRALPLIWVTLSVTSTAANQDITLTIGGTAYTIRNTTGGAMTAEGIAEAFATKFDGSTQAKGITVGGLQFRIYRS